MAAPIHMETIYTVIILLSCAVIVRHTGRLYNLCFHSGIRYFQEAFAFYGLGFLLRFIAVLGKAHNFIPQNVLLVLSVLFEYLICLGGFFLVYSLIWKQMAQNAPAPFSCRCRIVALHALAIAVALADISLNTYHFLYIGQLIALGYAGLLAYDHWRTRTDRSVKHTFASLYLIALIAAFIAYVGNYLVDIFVNTYPALRTLAYILNAAAFLTILFGVLRIVHSQAYCDKCCPEKHGKKTRKA